MKEKFPIKNLGSTVSREGGLIELDGVLYNSHGAVMIRVGRVLRPKGARLIKSPAVKKQEGVPAIAQAAEKSIPTQQEGLDATQQTRKKADKAYRRVEESGRENSPHKINDVV